MTFKDQAKSTVMGLIGLGAPAALINHFTFSVAPDVVLIGVVIASLVGYGFGAWTVARACEEETDDAEGQS